MEREERELIMKQFRDNKISILVSTSLLSGIDLRNVLFVINADLPKNYRTNIPDYHTYQRRIGMTGRFGDVGIALNLVSKD